MGAVGADMGLFSQTATPNIPDATDEYEASNMQRMINALRTYFNRTNSIQHINVASLNINIDTLPTQVDIASLRVGDIYQDTTAGNVLKVKP